MSKEPFLAGHIDMLILAIVAREAAHGYGIIEQLRLRSRGVVDLPEGTVYPALYRLEGLGFLASDAREVSGRTRRVYRITRAGRAALKERETSWRALVTSMDAILRGGAAPGHA